MEKCIVTTNGFCVCFTLKNFKRAVVFECRMVVNKNILRTRTMYSRRVV